MKADIVDKCVDFKTSANKLKLRPWSVASKHSALLVSNQNIPVCHSGRATDGLKDMTEK